MRKINDPQMRSIVWGVVLISTIKMYSLLPLLNTPIESVGKGILDEEQNDAEEVAKEAY